MFFFFKQKTAYEMSASLVGSEMCIRDRTTRVSNLVAHRDMWVLGKKKMGTGVLGRSVWMWVMKTEQFFLMA